MIGYRNKVEIEKRDKYALTPSSLNENLATSLILKLTRIY